MARRTYLSRIAQPLTSGDPVVWSTPHAPMDEARPSARVVRPPARQPLETGPAARPPLRGVVESEAAAAFPAPPAPPAPSAPIGPAKAPERLVDATMTTRTPIVGRTRDADGAGAGAPVPAPSLEASFLQPGNSRVEIAETMISRPAPTDDVALDVSPPAAATTPTAEDPDEPRPAASRVTAPANADRAFPGIEKVGSAAPPALEDDVTPPARSRRLPASALSGDGAPRLNIGAIEIRMISPPPPPAPTPPAPVIAMAPASAPSSLSRAYTSRFGLAQS